MVFFSYLLEEQENIVVPTIKQSMENVMVGHHSCPFLMDIML